MKRILLGTVSTLVFAGAALAAEPSGQTVTEAAAATEVAAASPAAPTDADAEASADAERKICRTDKVTGSLSRRNRICLTAAQWREVHDRTRRGVGDMQNGASGGKECVVDEYGGCRVSI